MVRLLPWCLLTVSSANLISISNEEDSSSLLQMQLHPNQIEGQHQPKASKLLLQVQEIASNIDKQRQAVDQDPVRQCQGGWRDGSGVGGSQQALGQAASQDACITMVRQQCNDANAATYESASSSCTCEAGQTNLDASVTGSKNCAFFAGETTDANLRTAVDALGNLVDSIITAMDTEQQSSTQILNTAFASVTAAENQITSVSATTIEAKRAAAAEARAASDTCSDNLEHWTAKQAEDCPAWTGHAASLSSCSNACPCQLDSDNFFSAFEVWESILANGGGQQIRDLKQKCDDANSQVATLTTSCPLLLATAIEREAEYGEAAESHLQHCSSFEYAAEAYESVRLEVTTQQNQRRSEYEILQQVKCYIDAIEDSTNLSDQVASQCATTEFDGQGASRYDITFNTVPESPTCLDVIRGFDGVPGCFPLLLDYHLENAANAPAAPPLNTGSFTSIRAVRKTGALSCNDQSNANPTVWNKCCGDSYREDCQGGFELMINGQRVLEQATGSVLPNECDIPTSPAGDIVCQRDLQVAASDELTVTWFETSRQHSTQNNVVDLVVDLYGCNTVPHPATPGWHLVAEDGVGEGHGCANSYSQWCCGDDRTRILDYPSACSNGAPYHIRVETQDGSEWVEFKTETCIFDGDLNDPNVDIYEVTSSHPNSINDESQFCKACSATGTRWGDSCWGVVTDNYRQCGCNSGGWVGTGMYYGSWSNAEAPTACGPWPGSFSGFKSNGQAKGGQCGKGMRILIHE